MIREPFTFVIIVEMVAFLYGSVIGLIVSWKLSEKQQVRYTLASALFTVVAFFIIYAPEVKKEAYETFSWHEGQVLTATGVIIAILLVTRLILFMRSFFL